MKYPHLSPLSWPVASSAYFPFSRHRRRDRRTNTTTGYHAFSAAGYVSLFHFLVFQVSFFARFFSPSFFLLSCCHSVIHHAGCCSCWCSKAVALLPLSGVLSPCHRHALFYSHGWNYRFGTARIRLRNAHTSHSNQPPFDAIEEVQRPVSGGAQQAAVSNQAVSLLSLVECCLLLLLVRGPADRRTYRRRRSTLSSSPGCKIDTYTPLLRIGAQTRSLCLVFFAPGPGAFF